jgi:hypothetical protein
MFFSSSPTTFERWSITHKLGDDYYHKLTNLLCHGRGSREECEELATSYLSALQELEEHLSTLERSDDVVGMKRSAKTHINHVRKDLTQFSNRA